MYTVPTLGRDKVATPFPPMSVAGKSLVPEKECQAGQYPVLTCMPLSRHLIFPKPLCSHLYNKDLSWGLTGPGLFIYTIAKRRFVDPQLKGSGGAEGDTPRRWQLYEHVRNFRGTLKT